MPWNGSGSFSRTSGQHTGATTWQDTHAAGRKMRDDDFDAHDNDIAAGIQNCLTKDGQNAPTGPLPMGGQKHTNVGNASARNQYAAYGQVLDAAGAFVDAAGVAGTANAITLTPDTAITAYSAGMQFRFIVETTNTGAVTVDVSGVGPKSIFKAGAQQLAAGDIKDGDVVSILYDGTQFYLVSGTADQVVLTEAAYTALATKVAGRFYFTT